jgi:hypothetical protein
MTVEIGSNSSATIGNVGLAEVHGMASGPPVAIAASFASLVGQVALLNQNAGPVQLGLRAFFSPPGLNFTDASATGPNEPASAHSRFQLFLDGNSLFLEDRTFRSGDPFRSRHARLCFPNVPPEQLRPGICGDFDFTGEASLTPGFHSLMFIAQADGVAVVTPEPTTLLLFGTTAAGLGVARWRQRRRKQQQP